MANYTVDEFNRTRSRMAGVFNWAISDAEKPGRAASEVPATAPPSRKALGSRRPR